MAGYLKISITCLPSVQEMLIAELAEAGYDAFRQDENLLEAFIGEDRFDKEKLQTVLTRYGLQENYSSEQIAEDNWNRKWEENFDPVTIDDQVMIRASFHKPLPGIRYDIVINPKMSFGTGHHETTRLIISEQLLIDHHDKRVLDVGTGTGILSVMARKAGAKDITATDIDDWCIENCRENFALNGLENFTVLQGTIDNLTLPGEYDIIIANINKNVLLAEMAQYGKLLSAHGILLLSGFYEHDVDDLKKEALKHGLKTVKVRTQNQWAMMKLVHQS